MRGHSFALGILEIGIRANRRCRRTLFFGKSKVVILQVVELRIELVVATLFMNSWLG
jgi:hypothetical protein